MTNHKVLLLLRHAKSSWTNSELADKDRPLNKRGKQNATTMGKYLKKEDLVPDLIVSSTAKRSYKTASIIAKNSGYDKKIGESELLYTATPDDYAKIINDIHDRYNIVMLVAHNPVLEDVIQRILGEYHIMKTCSLAHIELSIKSWTKFHYGVKSKLIDLIIARESEDVNSSIGGSSSNSNRNNSKNL